MVAALVLWMFQSGFSLEPGYYELGDLCNRLSRSAGVPVSASSQCSSDLYIATFEHCAPADVLEALTRTGRLEVSKEGAGYRVSPDSAHVSEMAQLFAAQVEEALGSQAQRYRTDVAEIQRLVGKPQDDADGVVDSYQSSANGDPLKIGIGSDLFGYFEGELPYMSMSFPNRLLSNANGEIPTQYLVADMGSSPQMFTPWREIRQDPFYAKSLYVLGIEKAQYFISNVKFGGKLCYDPARNMLGFHLAVDNRDSSMTVVVPSDVKVIYSSAAMFGQQNYSPKGLDERLQVCTRLSANPSWSQSIDLPKRSLSVGESLLYGAKAVHANLVGYIGSFSDRCLPRRPQASLLDTVTLANGGGFNAEFEALRSNERGFTEPNAQGGHDLLNGSLANGVFAIRDELDYREQFEQPGVEPNLQVVQQGFTHGFVTTSQVFKAVGALRMDEWNRSIFPERFLPWCNPLSLYPFVKLIEADDRFAKEFGNVETGAKREISLSELSEKGFASLDAAIREAEMFLDAPRASRLDVVASSVALERADRSKAVIEIVKDAHSYRLSIVLKELPGWSSTQIVWTSRLLYDKS